MKWQIVYTWQGERHLGAQFSSKLEALTELRLWHADKWNAWIEPIR